MKPYDVIVVGMGPGGSAASYKLASKGLDVLAIDKDSFPRYKPCGGCISTKVNSIQDLNFDSVIEGTIYGATFTYRSARHMDIISDSCLGYNVMRDRFDALMMERARSSGVNVLEGKRVKGVKESDGLITVMTDSGERYSSRYLVGADGAGGVIGREYFGFTPKACAVTITAEVPLERGRRDDLDGRLFIDFGGVPYGYSWIFPKEEFLSIGLATEAERVKVRGYLDELISSHDVLRGIKVDKTVGWTMPLYYSSSKDVVKGRAVVIGDAGHLVDPFLGEGIYFSIRTAEIAADIIVEEADKDGADLGAYQDVIKKELYPEFDAALKLSRLAYNHPRIWYKTLEGDPKIMEQYYNVIRGEETYPAFYGWLIDRLKAKPWKLAKGWLESRFFQA
ncbi:MAG: NAD(P)/FAD-dependent oxidoreductase [Thermodesulfobacteriota bacterium]